MSSLKKVYCRAFQYGLNVASRLIYWRKPLVVRGAGSRRKLPELFRELNTKRVLVVTGRHVGQSIAPGIIADLESAGIVSFLFAEVEANPTTAVVTRIVELYKKENCGGFLAIGGGSPIDAAKAAAALIARPNKTLGQMAGLLKVLKKLPPLIAVPTTAGTGSETTIAAVITDSDTHHKYAVMDVALVPRYAVLDPELTCSLSPKLTAATGMDALTHAVEAYLCVTNRTKEVDRLAAEASVTVFRYLERAYRDGNDMEAREAMLNASFKAGFAFSRSGVGNVHAIAHTLGGLYGTAHGLANAVILPIVLEDYGSAVYHRLAKLSELCGVAQDRDEEAGAKAFIAEIYAMNERMGIPKGFDFIREEDIPQMVEWALHEANPIYPVPVIYDEKRCTEVIHKIML